MFSIWFFLSLLENSCSQQLAQVQVLWRHGDRSPLHVYPTDPFKSYWDTWLTGELSSIGMGQLYYQGINLRQRYQDNLKFLPQEYDRRDILIRSSATPRCIQSAQSLMAGFYELSQNSHPVFNGWPMNWTPIPIETISSGQDHLLEPGANCARYDELLSIRGVNEQFLVYEAEREPMEQTIATNSGDSITQFSDISHFYDCVSIEKNARNFTLPKWITPELYTELQSAHFRIRDFLEGQADFGEGEDTEIILLSGGPLLKQMCENMVAAQNLSSTKKLIGYSAHDSTINALLRTMGAKTNVVGKRIPEYGAVLALELWHDLNSHMFYVQMVYSSAERAPFQIVTQFIQGCTGQSLCPLQIFLDRARPYLPSNIYEQCLPQL